MWVLVRYRPVYCRLWAYDLLTRKSTVLAIVELSDICGNGCTHSNVVMLIKTAYEAP